MGIGLDLTSHSPRCFRMVWMTSRSSMKLMICMIPRHFGQVRGSTFPDPVGDRLRSSGSTGPSSFGIPSNFYRLPGCRGPGRLRFLFAFPGRHYCNIYNTVLPPSAGLLPVRDVGTSRQRRDQPLQSLPPYSIRGHRRPFPRFRLSPGKQPLRVLQCLPWSNPAPQPEN